LTNHSTLWYYSKTPPPHVTSILDTTMLNRPKLLELFFKLGIRNIQRKYWNIDQVLINLSFMRTIVLCGIGTKRACYFNGIGICVGAITCHSTFIGIVLGIDGAPTGVCTLKIDA
jgi:hypothetical protein